MFTLTEWTVIVLLSLGVIKMIVGIISPKVLIGKKNPFSKLYLENKQWRLVMIYIIIVFMIFVSFK